MIVSRPNFSIFFGGQDNSFAPQQFYDVESEVALRAQQQFKQVCTELQITSLHVLKQTHSNLGLVLTAENLKSMKPYQQEGDYLITDVVGAGVAIATADCVPLILYDTQNHVLAAIHAGWRGSVALIALRAVEAMQQNFGSQAQDIEAVFGPSARSCCYAVGEDFITRIPTEYRRQVFSCRDSRQYFDTVFFNKLMLQGAGMPAQSIFTEYAVCTICSPVYCSYRRDGQKANRQMSIAVLKPV